MTISAACLSLSNNEYKGTPRATLERRYREIVKDKKKLPNMFGAVDGFIARMLGNEKDINL
jgi:hypothetical protein